MTHGNTKIRPIFSRLTRDYKQTSNSKTSSFLKLSKKRRNFCKTWKSSTTKLETCGKVLHMLQGDFKNMATTIALLSPFVNSTYVVLNSLLVYNKQTKNTRSNNGQSCKRCLTLPSRKSMTPETSDTRSPVKKWTREMVRCIKLVRWKWHRESSLVRSLKCSTRSVGYKIWRNLMPPCSKIRSLFNVIALPRTLEDRKMMQEKLINEKPEEINTMEIVKK